MKITLRSTSGKPKLGVLFKLDTSSGSSFQKALELHWPRPKFHTMRGHTRTHNYCGIITVMIQDIVEREISLVDVV